MARNPSPRAVLTVAANNLTVTADSSNSTVHPGNIASRRYDWGDGSFKTNGASSEQHTYAAAGTYSVRLTVTSNKGSAATTTKSVTATAVPTPPVGSGVLTESDFTYLGLYDVPNQLLGELNYGQGFTYRYVNGELRFLTFTFMGNNVDTNLQYRLIEFAAPAIGGTVSALTNSWPDISSGTLTLQGCFGGIWWDETNQRLWLGRAIDYPNDAEIQYTQALSTRTLNSDGTISNLRGQWGFSGIGARQLYGGVQATPSWFQSTYSVGPFCAGWGGYASRAAQGLATSIGPSMFFFNEPTSSPDSSNIAFTTAMDCSSGWGSPWYPAASNPTSLDRGVRNSDVTETFDAWTSPAPDGLGRWTWGDSNYNTGCWIDGSNKQGFITVPSFASGNAFYSGSTLHCDGRNYEIQVFDPADLGSAIQGSLPTWNVKPSSRWLISLPYMGSGPAGLGGNGPAGNVGGACYDPISECLYVYGISGSDWHSRIYVFQVNS